MSYKEKFSFFVPDSIKACEVSPEASQAEESSDYSDEDSKCG